MVHPQTSLAGTALHIAQIPTASQAKCSQISLFYMVEGLGTSTNQPGWDRSPHYAETHNFSGKTFTDKPFGPQRNLHAKLKNMGKAGSIRIATV